MVCASQIPKGAYASKVQASHLSGWIGQSIVVRLIWATSPPTEKKRKFSKASMIIENQEELRECLPLRKSESRVRAEKVRNWRETEKTALSWQQKQKLVDILWSVKGANSCGISSSYFLLNLCMCACSEFKSHSSSLWGILICHLVLSLPPDTLDTLIEFALRQTLKPNFIAWEYYPPTIILSNLETKYHGDCLSLLVKQGNY